MRNKTVHQTKPPLLIDDLNFVLNNLFLPIVIIDGIGRIRRFNVPWFEKFSASGDKPDEYVNKDYLEILSSLEKRKIYSKAIKSKITDILKKYFAGNFKPQNLEIPIGESWYLCHIQPVHAEGHLSGIIITHHDVTILKQKEFTLYAEKTKTFESSQRKMFFLANLNHELKSPLNSIMGFSQLLKEQISSNVHLQGFESLIENINEAASHLNSIVFRILNMAKIESGTLILQEERVTSGKLVQLSLNIVEPMFPSRSIKFEIAEEAAIETLKCDKNLAMEVLINLLVNALKFSDQMVRINCAMDEGRNLVFKVIDRGCGMTEEEIHVALEPFGQNIRSPSDKNTGLGLGVPFCNQVMALHGGYLKIESEKGKGTTAIAVFPSYRIEI